MVNLCRMTELSKREGLNFNMMRWVGKASGGIGERGQTPLKQMVVENKNGHSWWGEEEELPGWI